MAASSAYRVLIDWQSSKSSNQTIHVMIECQYHEAESFPAWLD